jgi:hypothetical protein
LEGRPRAKAWVDTAQRYLIVPSACPPSGRAHQQGLPTARGLSVAQAGPVSGTQLLDGPAAAGRAGAAAATGGAAGAGARLRTGAGPHIRAIS